MFNNDVYRSSKSGSTPLLRVRRKANQGVPPEGIRQPLNTLDLHWKLNMGAIWMVESTWRVLMTLDDMHMREASER